MMHLIEFDTIGLQALKACLARLFYPIGRDFAMIRPFFHHAIHLCRENDLFSPTTALRKPFADYCFCGSFANMATIDVGSIKKINTELERFIHNAKAIGFAGNRTEVHGAEAKAANL